MKVNVTKLLLASFFPLLLASCGGNAQGDTARHPLTVEVYPPEATVWLHETKQTPIAAALEQEGPLTSFELPAGNYTYEVHAPGYTSYQGELNLPQNRELSVWLSAAK